jgi:hypothetical protein
MVLRQLQLPPFFKTHRRGFRFGLRKSREMLKKEHPVYFHRTPTECERARNLEFSA